MDHPRTDSVTERSRVSWTVIMAWAALGSGVVGVWWSWWDGGIAFDLLRSDMDAPWKIARLRAFFLGWGPFAPLVYFLFVTVEVVVAPIPGLMLYAPGGVVFGAILGGALSLAGNVVGAGIACTLARSVAPVWLDRWFAQEKMSAVRASLEDYGGWVLFLLRLNPLTSSDIVSYAAGFTRIPVWKVMLATCLGMAPLCFVQAWCAENLLVAFPKLLYPLLGACLIYAVVVVIVMRRMTK